MPLYDKAFWLIAFFLIGVLLRSFFVEWSDAFFIIIVITGIFGLTLVLFKKYWFAVFAISIILGSGYFGIFEQITNDTHIVIGRESEFQGMVKKIEYGRESQTIRLKLNEPYRGSIQLYAPRFPEYRYGDLLLVRGTINSIPDTYARYFEKERISGTLRFAEITLMSHDNGSKILSGLFNIKRFTEHAFNRALPEKQAAFLSGILLGETAEFSPEFKENLSRTGTNHLVALSGYNISIIGKGIMAALGAWFSRRKTFVITTFAIFGFVIMTGAEASVVRAAIMGFLVLLADRTERLYSFRNALAIAAFFMILMNPKLLLFDVGFQLSFAAVMGLVYVEPALSRIFRPFRNPGIFGWRDNFFQTFSAQIAVFPILASVFGIFSPISLITNMLVLLFIPLTMFLGFLIMLTSILSTYISLIVALITNVFLTYELWVIDFFAKIPLQISFNESMFMFSALYYLALIFFVFYTQKKVQEHAF